VTGEGDIHIRLELLDQEVAMVHQQGDESVRQWNTFWQLRQKDMPMGDPNCKEYNGALHTSTYFSGLSIGLSTLPARRSSSSIILPMRSKPPPYTKRSRIRASDSRRMLAVVCESIMERSGKSLGAGWNLSSPSRLFGMA